MFLATYNIVYNKWDSVVKQQQTAPKKMKTFAETQKGKKVKKKAGKPDEEASEEEKESPAKSDTQQDEVIKAREALRRRMNGTPQKD
jgi:hypothetical protein